MVHEQGELINNIDENMKKGKNIIKIRNLKHQERKIDARKKSNEIIGNWIVLVFILRANQPGNNRIIRDKCILDCGLGIEELDLIFLLILL